MAQIPQHGVETITEVQAANQKSGGCEWKKYTTVFGVWLKDKNVCCYFRISRFLRKK